MMTEKEKDAYILGLKDAIEQIEAELDMVSAEYRNAPISLRAAVGALRNAALLVTDQIAMIGGVS